MRGELFHLECFGSEFLALLALTPPRDVDDSSLEMVNEPIESRRPGADAYKGCFSLTRQAAKTNIHSMVA